MSVFSWFKLPVVLGIVCWHTLPFVLAGAAAWFFSYDSVLMAIQAVLWLLIGLWIKKFVRQLGELLSSPSTVHGSARFASLDELALGSFFSGKGLILGRQGLRWLRFNREGNVLTFAPSRSGKGAGGVIPNLLEHPGSAVVIDVKGENLAVTARDRSRRGSLHILAPLREDLPVASLNPLDFIRLGTLHEVSDASLIADLLVAPHGEETFWDDEARHLITGLILFVASEAPDGLRTLAQVADLIIDNREAFDYLLVQMEGSSHPQVRSRARAFSQKEERERSAVISTAQNHLAVWSSHHPLARVTSRSDFRFEDLKEETATVYIVLPPELLNVYRSFARVMVGLAVASMVRSGKRPKHRVLFLLDEIAALGRMPIIEQAIGYIAGYGVTLWLFFQDLDQLQKTYVKWRSIIANCVIRQAFNVSDAQTSKELSAMLGVTTVRVKTEGHTAPFPVSLLPYSMHRGTALTSRPLMTEDEVMALGDRKQLIFVQGMRPILASKIRYFDWWEWRFWGRWDKWSE